MNMALQALRVALPSLGVGLFGLLALGWLMLTAQVAPSGAPARSNDRIGIIIPPWDAGGLAAAASFELPIVDLRWNGHLVVLDATGIPNARQLLEKSGYLVIGTSAQADCFL